jgi:hypothetical protein
MTAERWEEEGARGAARAGKDGGSDVSARRSQRWPGFARGGRGGRLHDGRDTTDGSRLG